MMPTADNGTTPSLIYNEIFEYMLDTLDATDPPMWMVSTDPEAYHKAKCEYFMAKKVT